MMFRVLAALALSSLIFTSPALAEGGKITLMDLLRGKKVEQSEPGKQKPQATTQKQKQKQEQRQTGRVAVATTENTGELRSGNPVRVGLFGTRTQQQMLPETRALDGVLRERDARASFKVRADFEPQTVAYSGYKRGTIVIDTRARYLYLIESSSKARRYAIAVGREGLEFKGTAKVGDKQEWPRWFPTKAMQQREPSKYGKYKDGMNGGPNNPLGARAIYLHQGKKDTHVRIHGTNQPQTIGTNSSNGCFRMINDHVIDLYGRVPVGADVVVL